MTPARLIDGINMSIEIGILSMNQGWHLKSLHAAAISATSLSKVCVGCMRGVRLLQSLVMCGRRPRKLSIEAALEATGGDYAASWS